MRSSLSRNSSAESSPSPAGHSSPDQTAPFIPAAANGRKRGKAPPPPTAASASYDPSGVADPLRPRASSDPFSDARNNGGPSSAVRPAGASGSGGRPSNRRGPAPPVPVRHHFQPAGLANGYEPALSLKDRTFSHGSAVSGVTEMEPMTPGAEDHHLLSSAVEDDDDSDGALTDSSDDDGGFDSLGGSLSSPRWRTWLGPAHLTNPELADLLRLFPKHIQRPSKAARFPYLGPGQAGLEEGTGPMRTAGGMDGRSQGKGVVECAAWAGTGRVWLGGREREPGWAGTGWERFVGWWKALFS
jgi:hypothetical protein